MHKLLVFLKGMAMGAADVIPGVSGGTIAFITGIYYELLSSINSINLNTFKILRKEGVKAAWTSINGNFLAALLLGIMVSIFSFAKLFKYLIEYHPVLIWSFFFGLILGSVYLVGRKITQWSFIVVLAIIIGTAISFAITVLPPSGNSESLIYIFFCGMLAICAMILPGISGSFILLLLGAYAAVLGAVSGLIDGIKAMDTALVISQGSIIIIFAIGCVIGLLSFSRALTWTLKHYYDVTIALLTGFLIGSLNKIWPWKINTETRINSKGEVVAFLDKNTSPEAYRFISEADAALGISTKEPHIVFAILLMIIGVAILFVLEKYGNKIVKPGDSNSVE
jgi:putative membrane protein